MKRSRTAFIGLLVGLMAFLTVPAGSAAVQDAVRPTYVIAFIPLSWEGSRAEFERAALSHGELFVSESGISAYADVEIRLLEEALDAALDGAWLVQEVVRFGLAREPADRYVGLTDQDLAPFGDASVAGWTFGPDSLGVVVEDHKSMITAHELGHTFGLCDEYLYSEWSRQNGEAECPNPYPPDCSTEPGVLCDGLPALDGRNSLMAHAGLRGPYTYNEPGYEHLQLAFSVLFGTQEPVVPPLLPTPEPEEPGAALLLPPVVVATPDLTRLDASGATLLAEGPVFHLAWSPGGHWVAFSAAYDGNLDIYRIPADGGRREKLVDHPARDSHPVWLPTDNLAPGEWLLFVSDRSGLPALYRLDLETGESEPLALPSPASWPAISPDGSHLAFAAAPDGDWDLYRVALSNVGEALPDTLARLTATRGADIAPAWRPDGSALAFASSRAGALSLYLHLLDGGPESQLTEAGVAAWAPTWLSHDRLLYHTYEQGQLQVRVLNPGSGHTIPLAAGLDSAAWPSARGLD